jgi:hypothetical protein
MRNMNTHEHRIMLAAALRVAIVASLAFASGAAQAQMGSWGVARGVASAIGQVGSGLGKKLLAKDKRLDLEAERTRFFGEIEKQAASLDPDARSALLASLESQWAIAETQMLIANAQATRERKAPLIDVKRVALEAVDGALVQAEVVGVAGGLDLGGMLSGAAVRGVVEGFSDDVEQTYGSAMAPAGFGGLSVADAATDAAGTALAQGVRSAVSDTVSGLRGDSGVGAAKFKLTEDIDPLRFLDQVPGTLNARDLYRDYGFIGWRRVEHTDTLQVFAPVLPDPVTKAVLFVTSATEGEVISAVRVLKTTAASFGGLVEQLTARENAPPSYASSGTQLRALWPSGVFVAADAKQVTLGWSQQAAHAATAAVEGVVSTGE